MYMYYIFVSWSFNLSFFQVKLYILVKMRRVIMMKRMQLSLLLNPVLFIAIVFLYIQRCPEQNLPDPLYPAREKSRAAVQASPGRSQEDRPGCQPSQIDTQNQLSRLLNFHDC